MKPFPLVDAFGRENWVQSLARFNIRHVEQLAALLASFEGRQALARIDHPPDVARVQEHAERLMMKHHALSLGRPHATSPLSGFSLRARQHHGLGYPLPAPLRGLRFGDTLPASAAPAAPPSFPAGPPPPADFDLAGSLTQVRDQYFRGTCVAVTVVAALESKILEETGQSLDLSEQYLYYATRLRDPDKTEDGTYIRHAMEALREHGVCEESSWPYEPYNDWGQAFLFRDPPNPLAHLDARARANRISAFAGLPPTSVDPIKQAIANRQPVCVGVPVFQTAWYGGYTETTGEVQMPLTRVDPADRTETLLDTPVGGHAILLVGYRDTPDPADPATYRPGGGYFVFKNSWGLAWASASAAFNPGFGVLPYAYLQKYNQEAYSIA